MKITKPPSAAVSQALTHLAKEAKPLEAAVLAKDEASTLGKITQARADALQYTAPRKASESAGRHTAQIRAALQDIDAGLLAHGKTDERRSVLNARLQEATQRPDVDLLALVRASLNDDRKVAAHLATALPLTAKDAVVLMGGGAEPTGIRGDMVLAAMGRQLANDLVETFRDLATKGAAARAQVEAHLPAQQTAEIEHLAASIVAQMETALDPASRQNQAAADHDRDTGITPMTLQSLERFTRDLGDLPPIDDARALGLLKAVRALVDAVRTQVENDPKGSW